MKTITITEDMVLEQTIALDIHWWIEENKDQLFRFANGIDRCANIALVVREAMKKARDKIAALPHKLPYEYCKTNPNLAPSGDANLDHPRDI